MGLDQYGRSHHESAPEGNILMTWRKHNRLQGYMAGVAVDQGIIGHADELNSGVDLELSLGDIENLENCINERNLPKTGGFFFGDDSYEDYEEYDLKNDLEFIRLAKDALSKGYSVMYSCWW